MLVYDLPLAEVIYDMHDKLKSVTRGYGTMDYELIGYEPADLVRLDILVNGKRVDALSIICDQRDAERRGRAVVKKLKQEIDRHMFEVAVASRHRHPRHRPRNHLAPCARTSPPNATAATSPANASCGQAKRRQEADEVNRQVDIPQKAFLAVLETGEDDKR